MRRAISQMIHRSSRASPGGSSALRTRWTRRSELVTVPSASAHAADGRQDDVGELCGRGQEDVLDDEEVEASTEADRPLLVGLGLDRVLADHVDRGQLAALHRVEHARTGASRASAGPSRPSAASNFARSSSFSTCWKPGSRSGRAPMSPPPWTLFWPRSGLRPLPYRPTCPVSSDEVDQGEDVVDRVVVLGDAERPADHRPRRRGEGVGQLADRVGRDARLALGVLERVALDLRLVGVEVVRRALDELAGSRGPAAMISRPTALASAMSLPTSRPSQTSAHSAELVRRGSTAYSRAPLRTPRRR